MGFHVYDIVYCHILIIAICDMQFEDVDSHMLMGKTFIWDHEKNGVINVNFKIFIVDFAQANFNIVGYCLGVVTQTSLWNIESAHAFIIKFKLLIDMQKS
jgi:hypothetical protein